MQPRKWIEELLIQGRTQQWIARKARVAQSTVYRIKEGIIRFPRINTNAKIEKVYQEHRESLIIQQKTNGRR
jgi:predicted transcriptional regulator